MLDFAFYGAIPFGFVLADPAANAIAGAALILSFYVNGASFLAYAIMAEKRGLETDARGEKSIFFTTGLAEATETIAVFVLACLFPAGSRSSPMSSPQCASTRPLRVSSSPARVR